MGTTGNFRASCKGGISRIGHWLAFFMALDGYSILFLEFIMDTRASKEGLKAPPSVL